MWGLIDCHLPLNVELIERRAIDDAAGRAYALPGVGSRFFKIHLTRAEGVRTAPLETVFPSSFASPGSFRSWGFRLIAIARSTASAWALLGGWSPSKAAEVADSPLARARAMAICCRLANEPRLAEI
jgi:hypothetical protein